MALAIESFFHEDTNTISYLIWDEDSGEAAIIDPVLNFDAASGTTATLFADRQISAARARGLKVLYSLETHVHADHLSAARHLKAELGVKTGIGKRVGEVQECFGRIFNAGPDFATDGSQFDLLFEDGDLLPLGGAEITIQHVPGHTPACCCYVVDGNAFVGDTLFMPDAGTARCDFPGGDARQLFRSISKILSLPRKTRLYICHDYGPGGRAFAWQTTVEDEIDNNIHLRGGISEDDYVKTREARDATLAMPKLILPSVQINMRAGAFPPPEENGVAFLKLPLNYF